MKLENGVKLKLKRSASEETESVKKLKIEEDKTDEVQDEVSQVRKRPLTRGVERISPYPMECRPSQPYHEWHRRQLVKDVTERLAMQGKRVVSLPRFLDDGIVFDWYLDPLSNASKHSSRNVRIYDKSILPDSAPNVVFAPGKARNSSILSDAPGGAHLVGAAPSPGSSKSEHNDILCDIASEALHDLHFEASAQLNEGCLNNPIVILEEDSCERTAISYPEVGADTGVLSCSDQQRSETTDSGSGLDSDSDDTSTDERSSPTEGGNLTHEPPTPNADLPQRPRRVDQKPVESVLSTYEVSIEDNNIEESSGIHSELEYGNAAVSLRKINWANYQAIIFVKCLPIMTRLEDVYSLLLKHGITFQSIKEVIMHNRNRSRPMSSIEFFSPRIAMEAITKLRSQLSPSSRSSNTSFGLKIEPCQRPKWYTANREQMKPHRADSSATVRSGNNSLLNQSGTGISGDRERMEVIGPLHTPGEGQINGHHTGPSRNKTKTCHSYDSVSESAKVQILDRSNINKSPEEIEIEDSDSDVDKDRSSSPSAGNNSTSDVCDSDRTVSTVDDSSDDEATTSVAPQRFHQETHDKAKRYQSVVIERRTTLTNVVLPKVRYGRPRRILLPQSPYIPMATVSMRGDLQFVDTRNRSRLPTMSLPATDDSKRLEDACIVGNTGILGSSGHRDQVSLLSFNKTGDKAFVRVLSSVAHRNRGISCLAPVTTTSDASDRLTEFISGGFDKHVNRWRIKSNLVLDEETPTISETVQQFPQEHNSTITSVAWHGHDTTVLSAAGTKLWTMHADRQIVIGEPSVLSNLINHIHVHPLNPHIVILEVAHPFCQVQVFDIRRGYTGKPMMSFGYADTSASPTGIRARHRKGESSVKYFVRGFDDGAVALWDYRNIKTTLRMHQLQESVYHTIFAKKATTDIWAFAGNQVNFLGT